MTKKKRGGRCNMKNKKLSKVEKLIRLLNEDDIVTEKQIFEIRIEEFENEAIIGIREEKTQEFSIYTITRKRFEEKYEVEW